MSKRRSYSDMVGTIGTWDRRPEDDFIDWYVDRELKMSLPVEEMWDKGSDLVPADRPEHGSAVLGAHGPLWTPRSSRGIEP
jgi:hypothetical protein